MRGADRAILLLVPFVALAIGFWLLVLAPKNREAGELSEEIAALTEERDAAAAELEAAKSAQASFTTNYGDLVSLGAAVPEEEDQATLIEDFRALGDENSSLFRSFKVVPGTASSAPAPTAPPAGTESPSPDAESTESTTTTTTSTAPATEAAVAALPLGAAVGPAGLPITPYELEYTGRFFDMADVFDALNGMVSLDRDGTTKVHGRLLTVDGFALSEDTEAGFPKMKAQLMVTTYLVPPEQGIAAGATPTGPPPAASTAVPTEASTTTPAGATAAVTP